MNKNELIKEEDEFLEDFEGDTKSVRKIGVTTIGKPGKGGGISGKNNPTGDGSKRIGGDQTITQRGEAPPKAPVKKVPKPAKVKQDPKLPSKIPGSKIGTEIKPSAATEKSQKQDAKTGYSKSEGMDKKLEQIFLKFNKYIGIADSKGNKSGDINIGPKEKKDAEDKIKSFIKKNKIGNESSKKDIIDSASFISLPGGKRYFEVQYEPGDLSNNTSFVLGLIEDETPAVSGFIKTIYFIHAWQYYKPIGIDNKELLSYVIKKLREQDQLIAEWFKGIDYNSSQLWPTFLRAYEDTLDRVTPKASTALAFKEVEKVDQEKQNIVTAPARQQESKIMNQDDIKKLIKEAFTDKVYGKYPYSHQTGQENEPAEDYTEDWKRFCLEMVQDTSKQKAVEIAKLLVRDIELFEDVLDLAGQNQSVGSEILRKMQKAEEM